MNSSTAASPTAIADRIIVPLDVPTKEAAIALIDSFSEVQFWKMGMATLTHPPRPIFFGDASRSGTPPRRGFFSDLCVHGNGRVLGKVAIVIYGMLLSLVLCNGYGSTAAAKPVFRQPLSSNATISPQQCPSTLTALVDRMLPDLPSYINRVRIRAGITTSYIVLAAKPEFEPLPLSTSSDLPPQTQSSDIKQVFFTTLMHRYEGRSIANLQEYHWVFFAGQQQDWQLAMMYSTIGVYPASASQPPLPPRNSSDGSVAVAIKAWLTDCRTGNLMPPPKLKSISPKKPPVSQ